MSFYAPFMLLFALLVAGPIWLHLFGAKRAVRVDFAAVDFLLGTDRKVSRAIRLRELLLLVARSAIFVIVPVLVAKPFVTCQSDEMTPGGGPQGAVLIIDNSVSSLYEVSGRPLLTELTDRGTVLLDQLGSEAEVAVLTTVGDDEMVKLTREHLRHKDRLRNIRPVALRARATEALDRAARLLERSPHQNNRIYLLTVGTRATLEGVEDWIKESPSVGLWVLTPDSGRELSNTAVTEISVKPAAETGARGITVEAKIERFGPSPDNELEVQLAINGAVVAQKRVSIPAGKIAVESFTTVLGEDSRVARIEVATTGSDALPIDDRRFVVSRARETIRVLLVNGDPRTTRHVDELFYVRAALERDSADFVTEEIAGDELVTTELGDFDVVVLANVRAPEAEASLALRNFAAAGGGVLIACGDQVDPSTYNRVMGDLLPQRLATVFDATLGRGDESNDRLSLRLVKLDLEHPIFKVFGQRTESIIDASFQKVALLGPSTATGSRVVLARYDNGAAAVVEGKLGQGRVLLFTSTLDRDWNDLAIHTGYVPFLDQALRYLGRSGRSDARRDLLVGEPAYVEVGPNDRRLAIEHPDGTTAGIGPEDMKGRESVRYRDTSEPGFYSVVATLSSGTTEPRPEASFAINLEAGIGDLDLVPVDDLPQPSPQADAQGAPNTRRLELWHGLGCALLLLLLLEGLLILRN